MSELLPALTGYIDGMTNALERFGTRNDFILGYRAALDDIAAYADQLQADMIEGSIIEKGARE